MSRSGVVPNAIAYGAAIAACGKGLQGGWALALLQEMQCQRNLPNLISCSAAISACEKSTNWKQALQLFAESRAGDLEGDVILFSATVGACEHRQGARIQKSMGSKRLPGLGD